MSDDYALEKAIAEAISAELCKHGWFYDKFMEVSIDSGAAGACNYKGIKVRFTIDRDPFAGPAATVAQPEGAATTGADITDAMAEAFLDKWCQREKPTGEDWSISVIYGVKEGLAAALKARTG